MERLSQILWRERDLLETLSYKLGVERMVLASGNDHWLVRSTREIENVLEDLLASENLRAAASDDAAELVGLTPDSSLGALADAAPAPWAGILRDHRDAMIALAREIAEASEGPTRPIAARCRSRRSRWPGAATRGGPRDRPTW